MPSATDLSVLIGVDGRGKPSSWSVMRRGIDVFPLWNSPPNYALAADATTCFRIIHYVWIGLFYGGGRFGGFSGLVRSKIT